MVKRVAILTNGGDCPGLNAVIRAIIRSAEQKNIECYGFINGYKGLLENDYVKLNNSKRSSGLLNKGGTIIGSSNDINAFRIKKVVKGKITYIDKSEQCIKNLKKLKIDCLFTLGGDGTQKSARDFTKRGVNIIGIPKTIDNDVPCTEVTFGFNTAVQTATDALDRLHTTAESHERVMILEVMGRYAGWIALASGLAGGADVILIPEIPYDIKKVIEKIETRNKIGKHFSLVVVSEGAKPKNGEISLKRVLETTPGLDSIRLGGIGEQLAMQIEDTTGQVTRNTTLGYVQRGGVPTATDRILSTEYGYKALELASEGVFNVLVVQQNGRLDFVPLDNVVGNNTEIGAASGYTERTNLRKVDLNGDMMKSARAIGISFGD